MNLANSFVLDLLKSESYEIYLVGGIIRDTFLNKENHDKDIIVCDIDAKIFAQKFADKYNCAFVPLDETNNIYRVVFPDKVNYIDITNPINNSLEEDLKRRDITINSIAYNIKTDEIIDINNGIDDIKNGVIRAISEENFIEDPLRIIRAYRFASTLGFEISKETLNIIKKHTDKIIHPAIERINMEILKLFGGKYAHKILLEMDKTGIIDILFPIMLDVKKVPPNTHHHLDLFNHSIETVKQIQTIYEISEKAVKEHLDTIDFGGETRLAHLKLAGFLHDIGKFSTWTIEENGRHRFIGHDELGANIAKGILKKQKYSKKQIEYITFIIRHHIYPSSVVSAPNINDKIYMRYVRKAGENSIDLITVAKADRLSARGVEVSDEMVQKNISDLNKLQDFYLKVKPTLKPLPKLIDGKEIMQILNISPSRELGEIINKLHEEQLEGNITTKEDAISYIKQLKNL